MLLVQHKRHFLEPRLPHLVLVWRLVPHRGNPDNLVPASPDNRPSVLLMRGDELKIELPAGYYDLRVQCGGNLPLRLISLIRRKPSSVDLSVYSTTRLVLPQGGNHTITFRDRERLWNILFDIDLVLWIVSLFVSFSLAYKIISDSFFAIWLLRLLIIRKRYYSLHVS